MTKLTQQAITKHSIVKALNKLYKRNIPIPKKVKEASDEEGESLSVEASHIETPLSNAQEANIDYSQQPSTEQPNLEQAPTEKQANQTSDPLDFSQSNWSRS